MNTNRLITASIIAFAFFNNAGAVQTSLQLAREGVINQYILDLKKADYKDITQLFEPNGVVVSTSRGKMDAKEFFYSFLPEILSANTERHQYFLSSSDANRVAARFHFKFKLKNGEAGQGEYIDEFIFARDSTKLTAVFMFENIKYDEDKHLN